jgi:hypothetical protein
LKSHPALDKGLHSLLEHMRTGSGMSCRLAALADSKIFARGFFCN